MTQNKLTWKQVLVVGSTLFGMFFGAGNLIFPIHLGQLAGSNVFSAMIGFLITAVSLPILAVAAMGSTHSDSLQDLASRIGPRYGIFFSSLLYLTIGPFFAIPRCATTSFSIGITALFPNADERLALLVFSILFFALVLAASLKPQSITTWIGRIINPIFLVLLATLLAFALMNPGAKAAMVAPDVTYETGAFAKALIGGYETMDALAGLAFGIVIINILRDMNVTDEAAITKSVLKSGIVCGVMMGVIYILTILVGAQSRGLFELSANGGIALAQIADHYLGKAGAVILALTITLACLKTSIGLVTSCGEMFTKMSHEKISYAKWAILFTVGSLVISNFGLNAILTYSVPMLMFLYPLVITITLLALADAKYHFHRSVWIWVTALTAVAAVFDMLWALPHSLVDAIHLTGFMNLGRSILPLAEYGFGWFVPGLAGLAIGLMLAKKK